MKTQRIANHVALRILLLMAVGILGLLMAPASRAGLNVPYTPDQYTLHLWHFDEFSGTNFFDCATNQTQAPQITLTVVPGPTNPWTMYPGTIPAETAQAQQPAAFPVLDYSVMTTQYSDLMSPFTVPTASGVVTGLTAQADSVAVVDLYTNLSYFISTNTGAFTIEALICPSFNPTAPPANGEIVCGDSGEPTRAWQFRIKNTGQLEANININVPGSPTPVHDVFGTIPKTGPDAGQANTWYHVAVAFTGTSPTNGQPADQLTLYWTKLDPTRTNCDSILVTNLGTGMGGFPVVAVGGNGRGDPYNTSTTTDGEGFDGLIDEVRISDVCRSSNQMVFNSSIPDIAPIITAEPPATTLVGYGQTLTITAGIEGTAPLQIQWQQNGTNLIGQTNVMLVISNVTFAANGNYQCLVTNDTVTYGIQGTNTTPDVVTVGAAPEGLFSTGVDPNGNPLDLTAPGSVDLHYTLVQSADANNPGPNAIIWGGTNLPSTYGEGIGSAWIGPENDAGQSAGIYEYQTTFLIDQANPASMVVSGNVKAGGASSFGNLEILVNGQATNITLASNPAENPVSFSLTNGFQAGTNVIDFEYVGAIASDMGLEVGITTALGYALTNAPVITNQPASLTNSYGSSATFSVVALGEPPLSYQWYLNGAGLNPASYPGANSRVLTLSSTNGDLPPPGTGNYQVVISNYIGSVTSAVATLAVNAFPVINSLPLTYTNLFTLYAGANPTFSVIISQAPPPYNYQWFTNGVPDGAATTNSLQMTNVQIGFITNYCIVTNLYGSGTSAVWTAQVIADPTNTTGLSPYPSNTLALNPVGYWRMNDTNLDGVDGNDVGGIGSGNGDVGDSGYICHDYGGGNDGIYTNVSLNNPGYNPTTDPSDSSAQFGNDPDGSTDFGDQDANSIAGINFAAPAGANVAFTVEAWVSGYEQTSDAGIVTLGYGGGGEQFDLDTGSDGGTPSHAFRFLFRDASGGSHAVSSSIAPSVKGNTLGPWYHLAGVVDEVHSNMAFYIDGQLVGTTALSSGLGVLSSTRLMSIGARTSSSTSTYNDQFLGEINDVAIFNYALSSNQIANQYLQSGVAPVITQQPVASTNVEQGSTLTVSAAANGTAPLSYEWFDENINNYIPGQTNAMLVVGNIQGSDTYYLTVNNLYGTTNSNPVTVTISSGLNVSLGPPSVTIYAGQPFTFTAQASGTLPFYYQWLTNGVVVPNATDTTYSLIAALGSVSVSCTVTNNYNGYSSTNAGPVTLIGIALPTNLYSAMVLSNNPAGFWPLNEPNNSPGNGNAGAIAYDYVGGNNGIYTNVLLGNPGYNTNADPLDTSALFGSFATPNSCANSIAGPDFSTPNGSNAEFSVEAWAESTTNNGLNTPTIAAKGIYFQEEYALDAGAADSYRFSVRNAAGTAYNANSTVSISNTNHWYHLVGVCNESNGLVSLYINGQLAASTAIPPASGITNSSETPMTIGARATSTTSGYTQQFPGYICDVAVYNYPLSSNQVAAEYQAAQIPPTINPNPTNIVFSVVNSQLTLSWPADHLGWTLQSQTNKVSVGISTNWVNVGGSTSVTNVVIPINLTNGTVFYRLMYP